MNTRPKTQADLVQMFEPVRADLEAVEREFERQVQSQVEVIPEIGAYIQKSGGKRVRPAVLLMAARLCGYTGPIAPCSTPRSSSSSTPPRWSTTTSSTMPSAARPAGGAFAVGQRRHGAARRLPLHQVDGDGADAGHARHRAPALRRHAADDRRRDLSAHQERRSSISPRKSTSRSSAARRRICSAGAREIGGMLGDVGDARAQRRCASTASTSASRSSWWTTCWITRRDERRWASRLAAICARARSRCRSSTCCSTAAPKRRA